LAIGRALVMRPKLLLLDEPTEGIQPSIIKDIGRAISYLRSLGNMAIVLVEQYLDFACELGDNFAVMDRGAVKYACDRSAWDRAGGPAAQLNIALKAEAGAQLSWLPQETILFDRARIARRIDIDLAEDAQLLLCEIVVFGRAAMGERMLHGEFIDRWRLRRSGKLVFAETIRVDGDIGAKLAQSAIAKAGVAIGTALIVPGDEALVERIREWTETFGGELG